jgi:hypothetical protein
MRIYVVLKYQPVLEIVFDGFNSRFMFFVQLWLTVMGVYMMV